ncbi:PH domain-containing protein [Streptomyces shenzhenensis]|uniref:PH domain-containing protein n=1 Tax=Streptomyces shenzhenensis TaxID=943815 RepID=UPI0015EFF855|nr:PH domain-containing protein [Streptomyces shenzhenensis]
MDEGGVEREYRKRRKRPWPHLALLGVVFVNALVHLTTDHDEGDFRWAPPLIGLLMAMTLVRILLEQYRARTRVTSAGITAQGPVRARTWAWSEVYDIRVEHAPRGSGREAPQWLTYLYDYQGRRFLLPHLDDWQLDDPYAEVTELCLAAAPHRSLTWERRPDVEERILRGAARRKAWTWGVYGSAVMIAVMTVVSLALVMTGRADHPLLLIGGVPLACGVALGAVLQWYWDAHPPRSLARQP